MLIESSTALFNAVNSAPYVEVCTDVCRLDDHVTGVEPTIAHVWTTFLLAKTFFPRSNEVASSPLIAYSTLIIELSTSILIRRYLWAPKSLRCGRQHLVDYTQETLIFVTNIKNIFTSLYRITVFSFVQKSWNLSANPFARIILALMKLQHRTPNQVQQRIQLPLNQNRNHPP